MNFLDELNSEQKKAVLTTSGPLLVLAGAGAGKTKTITYRILHLIREGVSPESILAVTFTNKAAKEMRERIQKLLNNESRDKIISDGSQPFVSTFHSLGVYIIKENSSLLKLPKHFSIYDRADSKRAIKEALEKNNYDPKEYDPGKILSIISKEKGNFVTAEEYEQQASNENFGRVVAAVWRTYSEILNKEGALDFDDLLVESTKLLKNNDSIRKRYSSRFKYIHIDEYQDTNKVQYHLAECLARDHHNICAVGDIDQNIYSWRGANIRNMLNFEKDYPKAKLVVLEENYRSTQTILAVANKIIEKNKYRKDKILVTRNAVGEKIGLFEALNESHEAQFVVEKIKELRQKGVAYSDIAVLYRANFQSRILEEACLGADIEYQVLGTKFFERKEIKDIVSFLRLAFNNQSVADLKRIINVPPRGIGKTTLIKIAEGKVDSLPTNMRIKLNVFFQLIKNIHKFALENRPSKTIWHIAESSGMLGALTKSEEDTERKENIKELVALSMRYDGLPPEEGIEKMLEEISLQSDQDSDDETRDAVRLMTVHASKGLEFAYVFVVGLEEGLFPHNRDEHLSEEDSEEERRLFYVAITRAKKKLFLSYAQTRTIFGSSNVNIPSEFVFDVPEEYIDKEFLDYTPRHKPLLHIEF